MSASLHSARIGYGGYSRSLAGPGDRRRFVAYARHRGLDYTFAEPDGDYDVVLLTHNADLPGWIRHKRRTGNRTKLIFELIDSYLTQTAPLKRRLKGATRYAVRTDSRPSIDFLKSLETMCTVADAVICSTAEQEQMIRRFNKAVFRSFDFFGDDLGAPKSDYSRDGRLKLVWEGQAVTLSNVQLLREPLNDLRDRVELHVVTDPTFFRFLGRFGKADSAGLLNGIEAPVVLHEWNASTFSEHIIRGDLGVIPIEVGDPMMNGKPENKLILLWQLGMPALTSPSPAYRRAMSEAGVDMLCADKTEWRDAIAAHAECSSAALQAKGEALRRHAEDTYSLANFVDRFDRVFASVGFHLPIFGT